MLYAADYYFFARLNDAPYQIKADASRRPESTSSDYPY
jgi:hypothetical protein